MSIEKKLTCAACKIPVHVEAKRYTETERHGLWGKKEQHVYYKVGIQCHGCGFETGFYRMTPTECFPEVIAFIQKGPNATYDDTVTLVEKLGFIVNEDGSVEL